AHTLEDKLIRLLTSTVAPDTWSEAGGPGTVQYYPLGLALVINQTQEVQEQIAELLRALRRLQDVEVAVEARVLRLSESFWERLPADLGLKFTEGDGKAAPTAFLSNAQLARFLEAAQQDQRTSVMQAPKLTMFNGQSATINATQQQHYVTGLSLSWDGAQIVATPKNEAIDTGFKMEVQPVVSADRRFVQLKLAASLAEVAPNVALLPA